MPRLRECFQAAGFDEVRTVLSSGNVVFSAPCSTSRLHDAARAHVWKRHHHPDARDRREVRHGV